MKNKRQKPMPVRIVHDEPQTTRYREPDRMHMSVRQISNGYIVNRSGYKNGKHYDEDRYMPECPDLMRSAGPARRSGRNERLGKTKL